MIKKLLKMVAGLLAVLVAILLVRTLAVTSRQVPAEPYTPMAIDPGLAAKHLAEAITHKTISYQIPWEVRGDEFLKFHEFLATTYPRAHATLQRETVANNALLYTWKGSDPDRAPIILLAHMDVVPVDKSSENKWTHPPFAGEIADGFVWGRGAIDDKSSVIAIFESIEALIAAGHAPRRTIYLAFGYDEELGGESAKAIAELLKARGVMAEFVMDEGSGITQGIVPGISKPLALIGLAEKGYVTYELSVTGAGGHSSQPPAHSSIGVLSDAITRVENNPFPLRLEGPMRDMLETAGPEMSFPMRMIMANLWLFKPLIVGEFGKGKTTAAALRTTTAVTMMNAGTKENVLPIEAKAVVNFRILQGDTVDGIGDHLKRVINNPEVNVQRYGEHEVFEAGRVSSREDAGFRLIERTARQVLPECAVAPSLVLGATDSKRYYDVSRDQYRFQPMIFTEEDLATIHGTDERIAIENLERAIHFYAQLLKNADQ